MISKAQECGVYECVAKLSDDLYSNIFVGCLYVASFREGDDFVMIREEENIFLNFVDSQDFYKHFSKVIKDEVINYSECYE